MFVFSPLFLSGTFWWWLLKLCSSLILPVLHSKEGEGTIHNQNVTYIPSFKVNSVHVTCWSWVARELSKADPQFAEGCFSLAHKGYLLVLKQSNPLLILNPKASDTHLYSYSWTPVAWWGERQGRKNKHFEVVSQASRRTQMHPDQEKLSLRPQGK